MADDGRITKGRLPGIIKTIGGLILGTARQVLRVNNAGTGLEFGAPASRPDVILQYQVASGTGGGTGASGSDQVRPLNTEVYDPDGHCALAGNQFTLAAGTWYIEWDAAFYWSAGTQTFLYNATDAAAVARGISLVSNGNVCSVVSSGVAVVTIAAAKAFELRYRVGGTTANNTLGFPSSAGGTEVYTTVKAWKIA